MYPGVSCGAGELGGLPYTDHDYRYYCTGAFFRTEYGGSGDLLCERAFQGDREAQAIFARYGRHLGDALWVVVAAYAPELIILGGAISKADPFFQSTLWKQLAAFPFRPSVQRLAIEVSETPDIALLGAAALCGRAETF